MADPNQRTKAEAEAVGELARKVSEVALLPVEGAQLLAVPDGSGGRAVIDVRKITDEYLDKPRRAVGTSTHQTVESFLLHVKRFGVEESAIFANPDPSEPALTAIYDYHAETKDARYCKHRSKLNLARSKEWKAWTSAGGKVFDQQEFAEFLEERIDDVRDPGGDNAQKATSLTPIFGTFASPNKLLELKEGLAMRVSQRVTNQTRLSNGTGTIHFSESHEDTNGSPLNIPGAFLIAIPVFDGSVPYLIAVRLRYRVGQGKVVWVVKMHDVERVFDDAFGGVVEDVRAGSELPVFIGRPE